MNSICKLLIAFDIVTGFSSSISAQTDPAPIVYDRLAPSFVAETWDNEGNNTGFAAPNKWGQYTAYLMSKNAKGQRTWRIEVYVRSSNRPTIFGGSTMYLLEGRSRAVLIDTGHPAAYTQGVNDLKTVVRFLLDHEDDGTTRAKSVDFVVANTHNHGDHIGENRLMNDRAIYYMDLDWPTDAPANYIPIREGGGATMHGRGQAVDGVDLGDRKLIAIALPPHTPGSIGYLDVENQMLFSGDAIGSGFVWVPWAPLTKYRQSVGHLLQLTRDYSRLAVFGAHFYQAKVGLRGGPPVNGRNLDLQYIRDHVTLVDEILAGTVEGSAYNFAFDSYVATHGSAQIVYSLDKLFAPGERWQAAYHSGRIAGFNGSAAVPAIAKVQTDLRLIRGPAGDTLYLLRGTTRSVLIGTGSGAPGLAKFLRPLAGDLPMDVVLTSGDSSQIGGLSQLNPANIYAPLGVKAGPKRRVLRKNGRIALGRDLAGRPLSLQVHPFGKDLTLIEANNRIAFIGNLLGAVVGAKWSPPGGIAAYRAALAEWKAETDGRYDLIFTGQGSRYANFASATDIALDAAGNALTSGAKDLVPQPADQGRR